MNKESAQCVSENEKGLQGLHVGGSGESGTIHVWKGVKGPA